jgi:acyl carrier protein
MVTPTIAASREIESALRKFVIDNFLYGKGGETLSDTTSFLDTGLIDSTGVLELVLFLESTFGIEVPDEDVVPDNLDSIARLCAYIGRKSAAERPAA